MASTENLTGEHPARRIAQQFFSHSAHVPIALLILELLLARGGGYFLEPDAYLLLLAGLAQATVTGLDQAAGRRRPLLDNLVGPLVYSLCETALEGLQFFSHWHHQAYWVFALGFALLQGSQARIPRLLPLLVVAESIWRAAIPLGMYALFEAQLADGQPLDRFFEDEAHRYLALVLGLLGLLLGFAELNLRRSMALVKSLTERLRQYSEWSLGRDLLARAIRDEGSLNLQRVERAVMFMDMRGFTAWAEDHTPEQVVNLLNAFYRLSEEALGERRPVKIKFTADEVMVVMEQADDAVALAQKWTGSVADLLRPWGLGAGIGIHWGPVVEGVLGGTEARAYDVIGDTVNTAKRLGGAAAAGEVLLSAALMEQAAVSAGTRREITLKGKREPLAVYLLPIAP